MEARERISGSIVNYVTGVSECSQQRGNLKGEGHTTPQSLRRWFLILYIHFVSHFFFKRWT
ncbi:hypothetical protein Xhom_01363 [Xenorhabdus hominickii]|uniref:Uncharacterized protein n=1 Tax=Xenorhabdus hominickii TaxID=351679 RepID=A0A2G0QGJ8_XENHO|nr:hypothetical protein Xhom_01363 [Xenorhabdus hominickii]